jgi:hypothetical protein
MEKMQKKLTDLINNAYGINQAMEQLGIEKKDVINLMQEDNELYTKLKKRFAGTKWIDEVIYKGVTAVLPDGDTPELAALKAEAKELGVEFNPQIGYDKLKKRVDEFKAQQAEATQTPEA